MEYELIRSNRRTLSMEIKNGRLLIRAPLQVSRESIHDFLISHQAWIEKHMADYQKKQQAATSTRKLTAEEIRLLADKAAAIIPERVRYYAPLIGVSYGRITIRNQRTRWGSCSSKGNLNFNCLLVLAPPEVLDSVVVHELCHRKEMNHSQRFYALVLRVFPDYRRWDRWLKENGSKLLALTT